LWTIGYVGLRIKIIIFSYVFRRQIPESRYNFMSSSFMWIEHVIRVYRLGLALVVLLSLSCLCGVCVCYKHTHCLCIFRQYVKSTQGLLARVMEVKIYVPSPCLPPPPPHTHTSPVLVYKHQHFQNFLTFT
jgi:hypothetical protein